MARMIDFQQLPVQAWKNGGGSTTEIAIAPQGAGFDDFDWRISVASVAGDGPFSIFPGIDRTLTLLAGAGMDLALADGSRTGLRPAQPSWAFAGEAALVARLVDGLTIDFNVMTRRSRCQHQVLRHTLLANQASVIRRQANMTLLFVAALDDNAACQVSEIGAGTQFVLRQYDSLLLDGADRMEWHIVASAHAILLQVELSQVPKS